MIDTAKLYPYMTDKVLDTLSDTKYLKSRGIEIYHDRYFFLPHPFGYTNVKVVIRWDQRELRIETSLPKLLQGHNVFGSNRLEYLCLKVVELIYEHLGVPFSSRERRLLRDRGIRLGRLDINCSFITESQAEVIAVLEAVEQHIRASCRKWSAYGQQDIVETAYNQQRSERVTDKFYNKYLELLVNPITGNLAERDRIMAYARNLVRFEVVWRAKELNDLGLDYTNLWSPSLVREMIMKRISRLNLHGSIEEQLSVPQIENLNKGCQTFYDLWAQGCNLRRLRQYAPLRRARDDILGQHRVDIFRHHAVSSEVDLEDLLCEDNAYFVAPKALLHRDAIFGCI